MANRLYIGARYIPVPFNNPDGSYNWLPGVAYEGLTIVIYNHRSYISKKPVPAISTPPSEDTDHWVDAYLYNADVAEALLSINELQETKADKDGIYPALWAGELISKDRQVDKTPYLFRNTGGSLKRIAPLEYPTLVGASVAENQLLPQRSSTVTKDGVTVTTAYTGLITISGTSNKESGYINFFMSGFGVRFAKNHVYAFNVITVQDTGTTPIYEFLFYGGGVSYSTNKQDSIQKITTDVTDNSVFYLRVNYAFNGTFAFYLNIIDLTLLFGSSIADYLYTLEQATAGAGIAKLREWGFLTGEYIPHNTGSLESVEATAHKMVGFNQWDEEWALGYWNYQNNGAFVANTGFFACKNKIPVIPNATYFFQCPQVVREILYYDANGDYVRREPLGGSASPRVFTTGNEYFVTFYFDGVYGNTYNHDICINLSNPDRNGEYEPYVSHTYDLGTDTLRGLFKLDSENRLYADGDTKTSDGTVTRRYGVVDLGTLNWTADGSDGLFISTNFRQAKYIGNLICTKYLCVNSDTSATLPDKGIVVGNSQAYPILRIRDSAYANTSAATFKSALSGVMLVYELATPTTEQSTPFTSPQICDPDGTEEFVTENGVPVGHETKYPYDLVGLVENLINVPDVPSTNGTYKLQAVRTSSGVTYDWVTD